MDATLVIHYLLQISMWVTARERREVRTRIPSELPVADSEKDNTHSMTSNPLFNEKLPVNKWGRYNNWVCNGPQLSEHVVATFSGLYNGRKRNHLLLFGKQLKLSSDVLWLRGGTWIYCEELNSWRFLDNPGEQPSRREHVLLVSICRQNVVIIDNRIRKVSNISWLFLGAMFKWKRIVIVDQIPPSTSNRDLVISVKDVTTTCSCRESVLYFSCDVRSGSDWALLYELVCIIEAEVYRWRSKKIQTSASAVTKSCMPIVTSSSRETVYTIIRNCLWYFSVYNLTWISTKVCIKWIDSLPSNAYGLNFAVFVEETMSYVLFNSYSRRVVIFNLSSSTSSSESVIGNFPWPERSLLLMPRRSIDIAVPHGDSIVVYLPGIEKDCGLRKWILQKVANTSVWLWEEIITTEKSRAPPAVITLDMNYSIKNDKLYVLQNRDNYDPPNVWSPQDTDHLWSLDLPSMRWEVLAKSDETLSEYTPKLANTWCHNNLWCVSDDVMALWQYNLEVAYSWNKMIAHNPPRPVRISYSLAVVNYSYMIVFGGRSYTKRLVLNDLWIFSSNNQSWKMMKTNSQSSTSPSPRYDHASVVVDSVMYVYGGSNNTQIDEVQTCIQELWTFHINSNKWVLVDAVNSSPNLTYIQPCKAYATSSEGQIWISIGCTIMPTAECKHHSQIHIWTYIIHLNMWHRIGTYRWGVDIESWGLETEVLPILFWKGHLLMVGKSQLALFYMKLGCPDGFVSVDITRKPCSICDVGSYAQKGTAMCRNCPYGITTESRGSTGISECSKCEVDYCKHGHCYITRFNSTPISNCDCDVGYTGSHCQYPTYYYLALGIVLIVLVTAAGVAATVRIRRKRQRSERALRREIEKLNGVWQISEDEIEMLEEIGKGAAGSVWTVRYRDMTLAMKIMLVPDDPRMCLEFAREIKFMQTMRHRNIVLFLGAGKLGVDEQPFLIAEYMTRGSLRRVLDDQEIELTATRKFHFASDAAQGMRFLHDLDPPRIHRDLKSANLLVSDSWIVKVADFGLGRSAYFHGSRARSQTRRTRSRTNVNSDDECLLAVAEDMSMVGIGTARWCAPELSRRQKYDGFVDVYSYGIVLWEIWTRDIPFIEYTFTADIAMAVERGERPDVPVNCPKEFRDLMQSCWNGNPRLRPTFNEVVQSLESIHETSDLRTNMQ